MKLFKVSLKNKEPWNGKKKTSALYVIQENKNAAISYVNQYKKDCYEITKVSELGYELGSRMFAAGKDSK